VTGKDAVRARPPPRRRLGFTLLELLLALSILGVILAVVAGALGVTVRAWEKGERLAEVQQRSRTILEQLRRQLGSTVVLFGAREDQPLVAFSGGPGRVEFTSTLAMASKAGAAAVHVTYVVEPGPDGRARLLLYEDPVEPEDYLSDRPLAHGSEPRLLAADLEDVVFEYLAGTGGGPDLRWLPAWQPGDPAESPRAVRITFTGAQGGHPVRVVAGVHLWPRPKDDA
jgi:general secretion pathway protein J